MFASRRSLSTSLLSALLIAASLSCGGDSSTGPSGSVSKVEVTPSSDSIALGSSVTLSASALDGAGHAVSGAKIFWNTENANVATVTSAGIVTGVATGNVRIAASSNGVSGFSSITVTPPGVASVKITPPSAAIAVDGTVHLQAATLDGSGNPLTGRAVTWSSSDDGVATVDNTGLVTGVTVGAVTITATSEGKSGTAGIAVAAQVASTITVAPPSVSITVGQTSQLTPTVKDASGAVISGAPVNWQVDNSGVASVSPSGLVTGVSPGTATVTATSGAAHTTVAITVAAAPPNAVLVSPSSVSLLITQRQQLTANVTDALGHTIAGAPVTWSSSNSAVAAVGSTGLVIAVLPGTATITATSGSVSGTASVTVTLVPVRKVTLDPDALSMTVGDQHQLSLTLQDSVDGVLSPTGHTVLWSSSVPGVASVTSAGLVSALTPGASVVSAKVDALTAFSTITVAQVPVATVVVTPALDTLILGVNVQLAAATLDAGGHTLTGRTVSWVSSDESIASVSSSGFVRTFGVGSATITATSEGVVGAATIVVLAVPVATVTVSPAAPSIVIGATQAFAAVTKDAGGHVLTGRTVTWSSSAEGVATIDASTGIATGVAAGTTTITATSEGKTGTAQLTVTPVPVATVTVAPTTQSVDVGATTPAFTATTKDGSGTVLTGRTVTWTSSDPTIATIDASSGVATGVAPGTVTITATSEGKTGTAQLTVNPIAVGSVTVAPPSQSIVDGTSTVTSFSATVKDAQNHVLTGRVVTWDSNNHAVATIDNTGKANGLSPGTVTITATSGGKSGTASLLVTPAPVATVAVAPSSQSVLVGSTTPAFTATTKDGSGNVLTGRTVTWSSSDPGTATIDASSGVATGVAPGTVTITATSEGKTGTASLTVTPVPVATVAVAPSSQVVIQGSTTPAFTATPKDASGNALTGRVVTWSSGNTGIATVDVNSGVATGVTPGTTTIIATSEGKSGSASLTVTVVPVATVTVAPPSQTIVDGATTVTPFTATLRDAGGNVLTGRPLTWSSSDNGIATIDAGGNATGVAPGTVTITANASGVTGTASLEVDQVPVATVAVSPPLGIILLVGGTTQFTADTRDAGNNVLTGRVVTWSSSDETIATVDNTGLVTGTGLGVATITATSEGQSGTASVAVGP